MKHRHYQSSLAHGSTGDREGLLDQAGLDQHLDGAGGDGDKNVGAQFVGGDEVGEAVSALALPLILHVMGFGEGRSEMQVHDRTHGACVSDMQVFGHGLGR